MREKTDSVQATRSRPMFKRPTGRLILLALLFAAATAYQVRVTMFREPQWFGWHPVMRPFYIDQPGVSGSGRHSTLSFTLFLNPTRPEFETTILCWR